MFLAVSRVIKARKLENWLWLNINQEGVIIVVNFFFLIEFLIVRDELRFNLLRLHLDMNLQSEGMCEIYCLGP